MTGILNVSNLFTLYHIITLIFILLFAIYDQRHHKICNNPLLAFLIWCLFSIPVATMAEPALPWYIPLLKSGLGFVTGFMILFCVALITKGGVGGGDIKLVAVLGIPFGAAGLLAILFISSAIAMIVLTILDRLNKLDMEHIPFAPYLFLGSLIYTLPQLI